MHNSWKRNTFVFISSQIISLFGSALVQYAIVWHITLESQSGLYATIATVCAVLPTFFLSPFAGVWADRYNRKTLIVLADGGIALTTLALAVSFMAGYRAMWLLFAALGVRALGAAVQTPCVSAMLPDIVPEQHYTRVNGINQSAQSFTQLAAPLLAAGLMGIAPLESIFFIDVATAAAAIFVMLAFLKVRQRHLEKAASGKAYFTELAEGFRYIGREKYLLLYFIYFGLIYMMAAPTSFLTPLQVVRVFGEEVWRLSAIEMAFAVGMVLGGVAIAAWGGFKNRVTTIVVCMLVMGAGIIGLAFPFSFWVYLGLMGLIGMVLSIFNTPATVMLQERVAPEYLGRVFGVLTMLGSSMMPLGMVVFGPLADVVSIESLLLFSGAVILVLAVLMSTSHTLRAAGLPYSSEAQRQATQ